MGKMSRRFQTARRIGGGSHEKPQKEGAEGAHGAWPHLIRTMWPLALFKKRIPGNTSSVEGRDLSQLSRQASRDHRSQEAMKNTEEREAEIAVIEAAKKWRTHHVCCPKDCQDLKDAQNGLGESLDRLAKVRESK